MPPKHSSGGTTAKRAVNVTVRSDLREAARGHAINGSATLEAALIEELRRLRQQRWRDDNREAIAGA